LLWLVVVLEALIVVAATSAVVLEVGKTELAGAAAGRAGSS
jgi:hypothetical protein